MLRLLGKRAHHNLSPMQQMLLIALGSAAGDVMLYPEVPLGYAALVLLGVTGLVMLLEIASAHFRPVRDYVESRPRVLVRDGRVDWEALRRERTTNRELFAELRIKGARSLVQVDAAILEVTGDLSVFLNARKDGDDDLLRYVLEDDHATTVEEMTLGACSVAVPIRAGAEVVAALGVVVPSLQARERDRLVSAMQVAARGIGRSLPSVDPSE